MPRCVNAVHVAKCRIFGVFAAYKKSAWRGILRKLHIQKKEPGGSRCQVSQAAGFLSFRRFLSSPSGGAGVMVMLCGMLCGNTCGIFADVLRKCAKRGDFCKIAALSCRNRAGSREGGRVLVTAGFNCFHFGNSSIPCQADGMRVSGRGRRPCRGCEPGEEDGRRHGLRPLLPVPCVL